VNAEGATGIIAEVSLEYPPDGGEPGLVAYADFRLSHPIAGGEFSVWVKGVRLMRGDRGNYFVQLPHEPRKVRCVHCARRAPAHARYCNWCGGTLNPGTGVGHFYETVVPTNRETRAAIVAAVVAEHDRRTAETAAAK
jgi:DNA-binding cell septation regulator SpoVG